MIFQYKFMEYAPDVLEEGVLYISITYKGCVHKCACGCGNKVSTPLTPKDWQLTYDGRSVSLWPSIGNWNLPCKSHYFIQKNKVNFVNKKRPRYERKKQEKKENRLFFWRKT